MEHGLPAATSVIATSQSASERALAPYPASPASTPIRPPARCRKRFRHPNLCDAACQLPSAASLLGGVTRERLVLALHPAAATTASANQQVEARQAVAARARRTRVMRSACAAPWKAAIGGGRGRGCEGKDRQKRRACGHKADTACGECLCGGARGGGRMQDRPVVVRVLIDEFVVDQAAALRHAAARNEQADACPPGLA